MLNIYPLCNSINQANSLHLYALIVARGDKFTFTLLQMAVCVTFTFTYTADFFEAVWQ